MAELDPRFFRAVPSAFSSRVGPVLPTAPRLFATRLRVDRFGRTEGGPDQASLDNLDGDGIGDLAVGVLADDDGGTDQGAVWILFLNADGTVQSEQKISETEGGFGGGP